MLKIQKCPPEKSPIKSPTRKSTAWYHYFWEWTCFWSESCLAGIKTWSSMWFFVDKIFLLFTEKEKWNSLCLSILPHSRPWEYRPIMLEDLPWLPVHFSIEYKIHLLSFEVGFVISPILSSAIFIYIQLSFFWYHLLSVLSSRLNIIWENPFTVAGSDLWSTLPPHLQASERALLI